MISITSVVRSYHSREGGNREITEVLDAPIKSEHDDTYSAFINGLSFPQYVSGNPKTTEVLDAPICLSTFANGTNFSPLT